MEKVAGAILALAGVLLACFLLYMKNHGGTEDAMWYLVIVLVLGGCLMAFVQKKPSR